MDLKVISYTEQICWSVQGWYNGYLGIGCVKISTVLTGTGELEHSISVFVCCIHLLEKGQVFEYLSDQPPISQSGWKSADSSQQKISRFVFIEEPVLINHVYLHSLIYIFALWVAGEGLINGFPVCLPPVSSASLCIHTWMWSVHWPVTNCLCIITVITHTACLWPDDTACPKERERGQPLAEGCLPFSSPPDVSSAPPHPRRGRPGYMKPRRPPRTPTFPAKCQPSSVCFSFSALLVLIILVTGFN